MSVAYAEPKLTLAMTTMMVCSLTLNGPGLRDHLIPNVVNCLDGMTFAHPLPIGQAIICATKELIAMEGARRENNVFIVAPRKTSDIPMTQARIVLAGRSSS